MRTSMLQLCSLWLLISLATHLVQASSKRPLPLKRISRAEPGALDILPRSRRHASPNLFAGLHSRSLHRSPPVPSDGILHTDTLRLRLASYDAHKDEPSDEQQQQQQQQYFLHLSPDEHFIHPQAKVNYYEWDDLAGESRVIKSEPLRSQDVRVFHGVVVQGQELSDQIWREEQAGLVRGTSPSQGVVGDARILFHPPSGLDEPVFEGAFTVGHDTHTIQLERNYMVTKHPLDPTPRRSSLSSRDVQSRDDGASLIIHRQSDVMTSQEHAQLLRKRAGGHLSQRQLFEVRDADAGDSCGHDDQEWNSNAAQQLFSSPAHSANGAGPAAFFVRPPAPQRRWYDDLAELGFGRGYLGDDRLSTSDDAQLAGYLEPRQSVGADVLGSNSTENFIEDIGSTRGCPSSQKVVYVGIAADCTYAQHYGSQDAARTQILNNMNSASGLYKSTFNVSLGVVELNVQGLSCPSTAPSDMPWNVGCNNLQMDDRLSVFSQWRGNKGRDGAGIWHLMTNCSTGSEVGVAWLGTLCQTTASGSGSSVASGTGVTSVTRSEWQVVAHEVGHNFGAIHDCTTGCSLANGQSYQFGGRASCCPLSTSGCNANADFIMNPTSTKTVTGFSQCSIGNICSEIGQGLDTSCLSDPGAQSTIALHQCGNGILDPGEECDAGTTNSTCCGSDCKLTSGSQCDPSTSACCTGTCQFASASTVCRPAVDTRCDTAETCTGSSADCPADQMASDGTSCATGGLTCASGHCTSRDTQCASVGASLGLRRGCGETGDKTCSVTCQDPNNSNQCIILQGNFIDGTSCGYAGRCENGSCKEGSWQEVFHGWYDNNLRIAIPVTIVIAIICLLILWALFRWILACCRGPRSRSAPSNAWAPEPPPKNMSTNPNGAPLTGRFRRADGQWA